MKKVVKEMNEIQRRELMDYATEQNDIQLDRINAIKEITGIDLLRIIDLKNQKGE